MQRFKTLDDLPVAGKRVLVRVDFNLPMQDRPITAVLLGTATISQIVPACEVELRRRAPDAEMGASCMAPCHLSADIDRLRHEGSL